MAIALIKAITDGIGKIIDSVGLSVILPAINAGN